MYYKGILQFKIHRKAKERGLREKAMNKTLKGQNTTLVPSEYHFQNEQTLTTFSVLVFNLLKVPNLKRENPVGPT